MEQALGRIARQCEWRCQVSEKNDDVVNDWFHRSFEALADIHCAVENYIGAHNALRRLDPVDENPHAYALRREVRAKLKERVEAVVAKIGGAA